MTSVSASTPVNRWTALAPRRPPSFMDALRLFLAGVGSSGWKPLQVMVGMLSVMLVPIFVVPIFARDLGWPLQVAAFGALPILAMTTVAFRVAGAPSLAFMASLPLRHPGKWLTLVPACTLALVVVVLFSIVGRLPVPAMLTVLGCGWWAVALGLRFAGRRLAWMGVVVLLAWADAGAARLAFSAAGWWLAAAVSLTMALIGLGTARDRVAAVVSGPGTSAAARRRVGSARGLFSSPARARRPGLLQVTRQLWVLPAPGLLVGLLLCVNLPVALLFAAVGPLPTLSFTWLMLIAPVSSLIASAYAPNADEFLRTRPLRSAWLIAGTVLPWTLIILLLPAVTLFKVPVDALSASLQSRDPGFGFTHRAQVTYLREIIGATWLPAPATRGLISPEIWARLRPLLYLHVLRLAILMLALLFAMTGATIAASWKATGAGRWSRVVLILATAGAALPCVDLARVWHVRWPTAPLWLSVALFFAAVASMFPVWGRPRR
jgi:hypothetical protein